jgi:NAD(P)-dependent dehydrogenase (short-subunit alcohol dehydrogenase family)
MRHYELEATTSWFRSCGEEIWPDRRGFCECRYAHTSVAKQAACLYILGIAEYGDQFFDEALDDEGKLAEPDRRCLTIDMDAACDTVKLALYYLRKNKNDGGSIVMTASLAGYLATAGAPHYSAAKHG